MLPRQGPLETHCVGESAIMSDRLGSMQAMRAEQMRIAVRQAQAKAASDIFLLQA